MLGKTEISKLQCLIGNEDVFRFDVAMDDAVPDKFQKTRADLFEHTHRHLFLKATIALQPGTQVAIAQLLHDVVVMLRFEHIVDAHDVLAVQLRQDLDF